MQSISKPVESYQVPLSYAVSRSSLLNSVGTLCKAEETSTSSLLAHLSRRLIGELIVYEGIRRPSVRPSVNIYKRHLLWSREVDSFRISHIASIAGWGGGKKSCVFCSNRIRTLVAIATYSSHRLIMGKEEIDNFFCLIGDILIFFFYRNVYWVVLYVSYDFCPNQWIWLVVGAAKRVDFRKNN